MLSSACCSSARAGLRLRRPRPPDISGTSTKLQPRFVAKCANTWTSSHCAIRTQGQVCVTIDLFSCEGVVAEATVASLQPSTTTTKHNMPSLFPFCEYLRTAYERTDNGGRREGWMAPAPLGAFRLRTRLSVDWISPTTARHVAEGFRNGFQEKGHILWEEGVGSWERRDFPKSRWLVKPSIYTTYFTLLARQFNSNQATICLEILGRVYSYSWNHAETFDSAPPSD
jgi:hypothetical protein